VTSLTKVQRATQVINKQDMPHKYSFLKSRIARRLIFAVVLFSSFIALAITVAQLYSDYEHDIRKVNPRFEQTANTHLEALITSVWAFDGAQINNILNGMASSPDIELVEISVDGKLKWQTGESGSDRTITKIIPLVKSYRKQNIRVGELKMVAGLDQIYDRLWGKAVSILVANGLKTLLVAGFMLMFVYYMFIRHLHKIVSHVASHELGKPHAALALDRKTNENKKDELDELVDTINSANIKLMDSYRKFSLNEQRLDAILSNASSVIYVKDMEGRYILINERFEELFNVKNEWIQGKTDFDILPREVADVLHKNDLSVLGSRVSTEFEETVPHAGGSYIYISVKCCLFDENNAPYAVCSISTDITDRKKAEEDLREKEELYRQLAESSSAIPWELDLETWCFTYIGPQAEIVFGYPVSDWYRLNFWPEHLHPDDREAAMNHCASETDQGNDHTLEYRMFAADGRVVWVRDDVGVVLKNNKPVRLRGYMFDISTHKEAQEILKQSGDELEAMVEIRTNELILREAQYQILAENVADGIFVHDDEGRIFECNRHILNNLGYTKEELQNITIFDINMSITREVILPVLQSEQSDTDFLFEAIHRRKNGSTFPVEIKRTAYRKENKKYFIAVVRDVSARKEAEAEIIAAKEEAESANNAKSEFLARMSHELRTPLNAILGFAQLLEMEPESLNKDQARGVDHILAGGKHLLRLIDEVLDIAKVDAGKMEFTIKVISLDKTIHDSLMFVQSLAKKNNIRINEPPVCNMYVYADEQRLKQVLVNLLSNAIKYNCENGTVDINFESVAHEFVRINIIDTGPGIKPEDQALLFEPFKRVGGSASLVEGTGIGLSITQKLLELMDGRIGFDSQYGEGSTFWIELPQTVRINTTKTSDNESLSNMDIKTPALKLLYIEDNSASLALIQRMIKITSDCEMIAATSAEDGMKIASEQKPDIILMDIGLPGMNGFEALEALKKNSETSHIPVIAVSANAMPEQVAQGKQAGFENYLIKPIDLDELLRVIYRDVV